MTFRISAIVAAGLLVAASAGPALAQGASATGSGSPDLILYNGKIVTVDDRFTIAQGVAIAGNRVVAVGTTQEMTRLSVI
jgi:hypothetical protein